MASKIEDYGIIADTQTAAIVSKTGSIDWLCMPRFDSDACFAALLGYDEHGRWAMRPMTTVRSTRQAYDGDTLVLVTEFTCDSGTVRLVDFMPPSDERSDIIRQVEGISGEVRLEMTLEPRFGYGANHPFIRNGSVDVTFTVGRDTLRLHSTIPVQVSSDRALAYFTVRAGERAAFQLAWYPLHRPGPPLLDAAKERARTAAFWSSWASRCTYTGRYRDVVVRSLLTLKALTYAPTGAIVAAPTASLPEELGGVRNWDYRFCWVRDAALTLHAFMFGGYVDEASAFRDWLIRTTAGDPTETQIMYDIDGGRRLTENGPGVVARVRGLPPRAHWQRRGGAVPARHLW